jgi:hypothetical protein
MARVTIATPAMKSPRNRPVRLLRGGAAAYAGSGAWCDGCALGVGHAGLCTGGWYGGLWIGLCTGGVGAAAGAVAP